MGIVEILTIVFVALRLAEVGSCANWDIIALPWHWSCLCLEMWVFIVYIAVALIVFFRGGK